MTAIEFTALLICLSWLYSEARMLMHRKFQLSDDFDLSSQEQADLTNARQATSARRTQFSTAEGDVTRLVQQGAGLRRNKNGDFDERSALGKQLNIALPQARSTAWRCGRDLEEAAAVEKELAERPKTRADKWVQAEALRNANRFTVLGCASLALYFLVIGAEPADNWVWLGLAWLSSLYIMWYFFKLDYRRQLGI